MSRRAWSAFAAVSVLWGVPYLFIKIADDGGMPPLLVAWSRVVLGAVVLLALAWRAGTLATLRGHGLWLLVFAVAEIAAPFSLIAAGEQHVASSATAILIAMVPLLIALLGLRFVPTEHLDRRRLCGLLLGLAGVAALVGVDVSGSGDELLGAAAILVAALGYACGGILISRKFAELDPIALMGGALTIAAAILTPLAALDLPSSAPTVGAFASVVVLGIFCTAIALVVMAILVGEAGPGRASIITYINPVIALALGIVFLDESLGAGALAGLVLILFGSYLSTRTSPSASPPPAKTE
jgi:drug/metabolite transporter (DMT)-like permease